MDGYEGRPHWGKLHSKTKNELLDLYPHFDDFNKIRERLDPKGIFLNDHLAEMLAD